MARKMRCRQAALLASCCRSGDLQGKEADSWHKRENCKAAAAFFLWLSQRLQDRSSEMHFLRDSSLMTEANWKLHQHWKGSLSLTQRVILPRINPEGICLKVSHTNNKNANQNHPWFSEGSLNDPSTDKHSRQECQGKWRQEEHRTGRMSEK